MKLYFYNDQPTTYFITEDGKCKNQKTNKWLKGQISKNGYLTYHTHKNLYCPQKKYKFVVDLALLGQSLPTYLGG